MSRAATVASAAPTRLLALLLASALLAMGVLTAVAAADEAPDGDESGNDQHDEEDEEDEETEEDEEDEEANGDGEDGADEDDEAEAEVEVVRISGPNRFATSAALSAHLHEDADVVYIATSHTYPDSLTGAVAAANDEAPLLLTPPGTLQGPIEAELERLDPDEVRVLGGEGAVARPVIDDIAQVTRSEVEVERVAGDDRYHTAVMISQELFGDDAEDDEDGNDNGDDGEGNGDESLADTVYLATGEGYADALVGAPAAVADEAPLLLTKTDELSEVTAGELDRLDPDELIVLGGDSALSEDVADEAADVTDAEVERLEGEDRFGTAVAVSQHLVEEDGEAESVTMATGVGWADAVGGAAAAGAEGEPALLVTPGQVPDEIADELQRLDPQLVRVLGGPSAITTRVKDAITDVLDE